MASYTERERTERFIEFVVPVAVGGACASDLLKAVSAARARLRHHNPVLYPEGRDVPDDAVLVLPSDGEIIVRITVPARPPGMRGDSATDRTSGAPSSGGLIRPML